MCFRKKAFVLEAQQFIEKETLPKIHNHVEKRLNIANLGDKTFSDIVVELERDMCLNRLSAPDKTTLLPLNSVGATPFEPKKKRKQNQRGFGFRCNKSGLYEAHCRKLKKERCPEVAEIEVKNGITNSTEAQKAQM